LRGTSAGDQIGIDRAREDILDPLPGLSALAALRHMGRVIFAFDGGMLEQDADVAPSPAFAGRGRAAFAPARHAVVVQALGDAPIADPVRRPFVYLLQDGYALGDQLIAAIIVILVDALAYDLDPSRRLGIRPQLLRCALLFR